jgi:hypothetical protein
MNGKTSKMLRKAVARERANGSKATKRTAYRMWNQLTDDKKAIIRRFEKYATSPGSDHSVP